MKKTRSFLYFVILCICCAGIFSCNNSGVSPNNNSRIQVINTLAGSTPIYFDFNYTRKSSSALAFPASSGYITVAPDSLYVQFQIASSSVYLNTTAGADQRIKMKLDSSYSLFLTGTTNNYSLIRVRDDLISPSAGKAKIRFVNTSVNSGNLNITVNGTTGFTNVAYKGVGSFIEVPAGIYEFKAYATGTTTTTLGTLSTQTIADGKIYTLYTAGLVGSVGTNAAFGLNLTTNLLPAVK